jgi:hypothetical protein
LSDLAGSSLGSGGLTLTTTLKLLSVDGSLTIDFKFIWLLLCMGSDFYDIIFLGVRPPLLSIGETLFLVTMVELEIDVDILLELDREGVSLD